MITLIDVKTNDHGGSGWMISGRLDRRRPNACFRRLADNLAARGLGDDAQLGLRPARTASTSSQGWKRAASANSTGTPSSSIGREVCTSSADGQPRHVKIVHAGGVAAGDLGLFVVRHPG